MTSAPRYGADSGPAEPGDPVAGSTRGATDGAAVHELRPVGRGPEDATRAVAPLDQQIEALRADLALKDAFALRVRADLRAAQVERDALADEVAWLRARVAAIEADAARLRAEDAALRAVVEQPGYRLMERASHALAHVPALQRAVRRFTRLAAGER